MAQLWHHVGVCDFQCRRSAILLLAGACAEDAEGAGDFDAGSDEQGANERVEAGDECVEGADGEGDEGRVGMFP